MNDIQKYDPTSIMKDVTDRVKATFATLIPDEKWQEMVQGCVDEFFKRKSNSYSGSSTESKFENLMNELIKEEAKMQIQKFLSSYQGVEWENGHLKASEKLEKLIKENASTLMQGLLSNVFSQLIYDMKNKLQ